MGIYDAWLDWRDRLLTSPAFHEFALKFPPTRPIVRKRQSEVFDVVSGFVYSQVLLACVELELLDRPEIRSPGATLAQISEMTGLDLDASRRLAKAAAALRLLEERNGRFRLGDLGAALSINRGALAMIRHHPALYRDLTDPVRQLRSGRGETHLSRYWEYARSLDPASATAEEVAEYSELMSASQEAVSQEVLASFNFRPFCKLMDVGGGQGTFLGNVAAHNDVLGLCLFDLPEVVERARQLQIENKLDTRIELAGGSFFEGELPAGADLISLVRILHDHDDDAVMRILSAVLRALEPGGAVLIAEPMSTGGQAGRITDVYFNFYLHAMGSGRPREPRELMDMLEETGFRECAKISSRSPFTTSLLTARKY